MRPAVTTLLLTLTASLTGSVSHAAHPAQLASARQMVSLPQQNWLVQDKKQLRLIGPDGRQRASLEIRSEQLDLRQDGQQWLAAALDSDQQRARLLRIDPEAGSLESWQALPMPAFTPQALCLQRDRQQLLHLYLIGEEGQAEQWLLSGPAPRKVRDLAVASMVSSCKVDDAREQLLLVEQDFGVWAYPADAEIKPRREAVMLRRPYGALAGGARDLAILPGGLAILDQAGTTVHLLRQAQHGWSRQGQLRLAAPAQALTLGKQQLWLKDERGGWQSRPLHWPHQAPIPMPALPQIQPLVQTTPVSVRGDAADDPAIWLHPHQPALSRVLGSNKKQGLQVYDLNGQETQMLPVGRLNNVDLRQQVMLGGKQLDLAVATHRDDLSLVVFDIDSHGVVHELGRLPTGLQDIYGVCLGKPLHGEGLDAYVNDKSGEFVHWRINLVAGRIQGTRLRQFRLKSQPEGCVVDEAQQQVFLGEEDRGVWVIPADPAQAALPRPVIAVGQHGLQDDVEGLALHRGAQRNYLVISSQGNNRYLVLDASPPYRFRGAFQIGIHAGLGIDAASETDGLEVSSANFGGAFDAGMLVVQDGFKRLPDGAQNFKYVAWRDIAAALALD